MSRGELQQSLLEFCDRQDSIGTDAIALHAMNQALCEARNAGHRSGVLACIRFLSSRVADVPLHRRHELHAAMDAIGKSNLLENWEEHE